MAKGMGLAALPRKRLALAVAAALMPFAVQTTHGQTAANTLPTGGQVTARSAAISLPSANKMQIDQASNKAILQWDTFSIGSNARVCFSAPSGSAIAPHRALGRNP